MTHADTDRDAYVTRAAEWIRLHAGWFIWGWVAVMLALTFVGYFRGTL